MADNAPPGFHEHRPWTLPMDGARRAASARFGSQRRWPSWLLDTARKREQTATPEHIDALAEICLPDQDGNPVRLRDLWRDGPAVIVWLRQFGCPFCRAYALDLNRARHRFAAGGVRLVLIGQGSPDDANRFRERFRIELPILTDADRVTYLWAGTKIATLGELIGPLVVAKGLARMARLRVLVGHNTADEAQLGGSIVVMSDGTIPFAHISGDASDVATPDELLGTVSNRLRGAGSRRRSAPSRGLLAIGAALALSACSAGGAGTPATSSGATAVAAAPSLGPADLTLQATDGGITGAPAAFMPTKIEIKSGGVLRLDDTGTTEHNLTIDTSGKVPTSAATRKDAVLIAVDLVNQSAEGTINLPPGTYQFYCSIDFGTGAGHTALNGTGMVGTLVVH
ncbi:MAG TPA: redoxin domain-containing protein [Candidatus Limnocylindrales bacterium]